MSVNYVKIVNFIIKEWRIRACGGVNSFVKYWKC